MDKLIFSSLRTEKLEKGISTFHVLSTQSEDLRISQIHFKKLQLAETSCCTLSISGFFCAFIAEELTHTESLFEEYEFKAQVCLYFTSVLTIVLILAIIWRTNQELLWEQSKGLYSHQDTLNSTKKLRILFLEILINLPHPVNQTNIFYTRWNSFVEEEISYNLTGVLASLMVIRFYHIIRLVSVYSKFRSMRSQRLCKINGCQADTTYAIKCIAKETPGKLIALYIIIGAFVLAFCMRVFERPVPPILDRDQDFSQFENSIWCVLTTMTTAGYGDFYPVTLEGRIFCSITVLWGMIVVSLIVVVVSEKLELKCGEDSSYLLMRRLTYEKSLEEKAARLISAGYKHSKSGKETEKNKIEKRRRFRQALYEFEAVKIKRRELYYSDSFEDRASRKLSGVIEDFETIKKGMAETSCFIDKLKLLSR